LVDGLQDIQTETGRRESLYGQKLAGRAALKKSRLHLAFSGTRAARLWKDGGK